jgi:hypothetical protein
VENLNLDRYLPEPDADDHYPTCPVFAPEAEDSVCDCDEETQKIRADFAEARYDLGRDA